MGGKGAAAGGQIVGGQISAAGSIIAGLLAESPDINFSQGQDPLIDPLVAALTFEQLLSLGIFDPTTMQLASPINQAIQTLRGTSMTKEQFNNHMSALRGLQKIAVNGEDFNEVFGSNPDVLRRAAAAANLMGMSVEQLLQSERQFQTDFGARAGQLQDIANEVFEGRLDARSALAALSSNFPVGDAASLANLTALERSRIDEQLESQTQEALQAARLGNFNPGRILGEIEYLRDDAELNSLARASALLGSQISLANESILGLQGLLDPAAVGSLAATRAGAANPQGPTLDLTPQVTALGAALREGAQTTGQSIANAGSIAGSGSQGGGAPAAGGTSGGISGGVGAGGY